MEWIKLKENKPKTKGIYLCFVPDCKHYHTHFEQYIWDGENFRDETIMGRDRIVEVSHYMILVEPQID